VCIYGNSIIIVNDYAIISYSDWCIDICSRNLKLQAAASYTVDCPKTLLNEGLLGALVKLLLLDNLLLCSDRHGNAVVLREHLHFLAFLFGGSLWFLDVLSDTDSFSI